MASRKTSASKSAQQRAILSSRSGGDAGSTMKQKRGVEPDTLVGLESKVEREASASMMIMEGGDVGMDVRSYSRTSLGSRSSSSLGQVPPRSNSSASQRVGTPTKHVSLTAVRRKQESESLIEPELDWREFTRSNSSLRFGVRSSSRTSFNQVSNADEEEQVAESTASNTTQSESGYSSKTNTVTSPVEDREVTPQMQAMAVSSSHKEKKPADGGDKSSDEDDDDDDSEEEEPRKAPCELFMEFLDCVMKKDFVNAEKLCRMILIYEPNNPEALKFHPIILEKLQLDKEREENGEESGSSGDDDEGDDDDDEDDDDDDSSSDDTSLDEDSSDDGDDVIAEQNEEIDGPPRPDSGIGM